MTGFFCREKLLWIVLASMPIARSLGSLPKRSWTRHLFAIRIVSKANVRVAIRSEPQRISERIKGSSVCTQRGFEMRLVLTFFNSHIEKVI